ncbi:hypothetical protein AMS68_002767 [Peltaster fructicola]|uniref:Autophagy-related protein 28 n=1 Tax=Peltaster fructicola TaxID=286661 RepID=A0A6H0XS03_9PEZI|nr:hypothetical protein AMS68_002767 [Peltaster fructicola]
MSSSSSWFARSLPNKQGYELPRWRSPSPMSASMIPPPIVQSTYKSSPKHSTVLSSRSMVIEKPPSSANLESELHADLQFLLDAQAEGLIRGLEHGTSDEASSAGSTTPTLRTQGSVPRQVNRPVRKKLGLRTARKGIYSCMLALAAIKDEDIESTDQSLQEKDATLAQIDGWEKKRIGLQEATSKVDGEEETIRVQRLHQESDVLQDEINKVETHLMELKMKQRQLLKQATALENAVQAKLSSYTTSINLLENEIKTFLSSKQAEETIKDGKQSIWQLPPGRRTLDLAKEQVALEKHDLQAHSESVLLERDALNEGSKIWKNVVGQVSEFERRLRSEMAMLSSMTDSTMAWDDTPQPTAADRLSELYKHMLELIAHLESQVELAEQRNWRLLIAAIGAELDALRRGKTILDSLVMQPQPQPQPQPHSYEDEESGSSSKGPTERHTRARNGQLVNNDDDDPDPELLFSVQDIDE